MLTFKWSSVTADMAAAINLQKKLHFATHCPCKDNLSSIKKLYSHCTVDRPLENVFRSPGM